MALSSKFKQSLKAKAHKLKPVVLIGQNGLTEAVNLAIDRALFDHELIKVQVACEDREEKRHVIAQICETNQAELVNIIGNIGIIYRKRPE